MKTDGALVIFILLIMAVVGFAFVLGNSSSITPVTTQGRMQMTLGHDVTSWINAAVSAIFKLALGGVFAGFGIAAFNEFRKAYRLWKRNAQGGRWTPGPNANWQRSPSAPKLSKQDMLLLALSGRLPGFDTRVPRYSTSEKTEDKEDQLDIRL